MKKPNLSKSLLIAYLDYFDENVKGCGVYLRKRYFEKLPEPSSDAMKLGIFFEYMATGYCPPNQTPPQPEMIYKGTAKEKPATDYERAVQSARLYRKMLKMHSIEVVSHGEYWLHDECSGIIDVYAKWDDEPCIIDLKYTSLFDDKFNEMGWHTESLPFKSKLLLQPIHYKFLGKKIKNIVDIPFYFWIFSAKDPEKVKIIKTNIQEEHLNLHEQITVEKMKRYTEYFYKNPEKLEARPSYIRCKECAFYEGCEHRAEVPLVEEIYY
jgi:hypothetical protein